MQTLEQASLQNSKLHYIQAFSHELHKDADMDFRAGINFFQTWISVDEELPETNEHLIHKGEPEDVTKTVKLLAMTDCGSVTDNYRIKMIDGKWDWFMGYEGEVVTHWRLLSIPIEL